jgi:tetratricopeptide (TPR) repeat protein
MTVEVFRPPAGNQGVAWMAKEKGKPGQSPEQKVGAALIIDLSMSTFAWDQDQNIARRMIDKLAQLIERDLSHYIGEKVNFTGDGFLFVFTVIENAIVYCARLIEAWEPERKQFLREYGWPPDSKFFIIRSGIEFGLYYDWGEEKVGGALNRAQRCESAGKECMDNIKLPEANHAESHFAVFVTKAAWDNAGAKARFHCQKQEETDFKGIGEFDTATHVFTESPQVIYAVWPKATSLPPEQSPPAEQYRQAAEVQSSLDTAETMLAEADRYMELSEGQLDATSRRLVEKALEKYESLLGQADLPPPQKAKVMLNSCDALRAISKRVMPAEKSVLLDKAENYCHEALKICKAKNLVEGSGRANNALGRILSDQASTLAGGERGRKLEEAVAAYREALTVRPLEHAPADYAETQNNLGNALCDQANLLDGEEKAHKLAEAVAAYGEALKVRTLEHAPADYAGTQNNLGLALRNQAELLAGEENAQKLAEAVAAFGEALKAYTYKHDPADYAMTQNNLGNALGNQANLLGGEEKAHKLAEAVAAYGEALKVMTLEHAPADYATTQNNLGNALRNQAYLLSGEEKTLKLAEAVAAYGEALKVYTYEHAPADYAMIQNNLGNALGDQADLLGGEEKTLKLAEAVAAYGEALKVLTEKNFPDQHARVERNLAQCLVEGNEFQVR